MSLRARVALLAAGAVALAVALAAVVAFFAARGQLRGEIDAFLLERAAPVSSLGDSDFRRGVLDLTGDRGRRGGPFVGGGNVLQLVGTDSVVQIIDPEGEVVYVFDEEVVLPVEERDLDIAVNHRMKPLLRDVRVDGEHYRMVTVATPAGGAVQIARSLEETDSVLRGLGLRMLLIGVAGVGIAGGAGWFVARRSLAPVGDLTAAAEHVAATEDLAAEIDVERNDEIGRLATSFNAMLRALARSRAQQHQLVMDASHELRTPLTSLRTNLEVLQRAAELPPAERQGLLADLDLEMKELSSLVEELVELATDRTRAEDTFSEVRLDEVADTVVQRARRRTSCELRLDAHPVVVRGSAGRLDTAISNLVDNAVKWSPPDGTITVTVAGGRVTVADDGPGIDPDDAPRVFDRFYRAPGARAMPGSGLGLSIVRQVAEEHGGRAGIDPARRGASVRIELPVVESAGTVDT